MAHPRRYQHAAKALQLASDLHHELSQQLLSSSPAETGWGALVVQAKGLAAQVAQVLDHYERRQEGR